MAKKAKVVLPVAPLPDLMAWWRAEQIQGIIIGALATSLLSRPRVTRDVDALVLLPEDRWQPFLAAGKRFGFVPRIADALEFAQESRVLLLRHESTGIDVDIALGRLPFEEEAVARAVHTNVAGETIPLPTPEDLVIMKAVAHREQDLLDVDALIAAYPSLDRRRVLKWVRIFADALETEELYDDLEARFNRQTKSRRGKRQK